MDSDNFREGPPGTDETMQFLLFFLKFTVGDGHIRNHSVFPSVILTKGVRGVHDVRFPHFIPISRANQRTGSGSKQLWDRLRLTTKQSFPAERIAEPWDRLSGKKIACCRCCYWRLLKTAQTKPHQV